MHAHYLSQHRYKVAEEDKFIILASDGVWEFIENQVTIFCFAFHLSSLFSFYLFIHPFIHSFIHSYPSIHPSIHLLKHVKTQRFTDDQQEAVEIVHLNLYLGAEEACKKLIETATERWSEEEGDYRDDITAIVVTLPLPSGCH